MCETILGASNLDPACYFCIPTDIVARIKTAIIEIIDFVSRWISRKDLSADEKKEYPEWNLDYAEREFLGLFLYGVFIGQISDEDSLKRREFFLDHYGYHDKIFRESIRWQEVIQCLRLLPWYEKYDKIEWALEKTVDYIKKLTVS